MKFSKFDKEIYMGFLAITGIFLYLVLRFLLGVPVGLSNWPLLITLALGGVPLVWDLLIKLSKR